MVSRPRTSQRAINEVRTLPLTLPKGGSRSKYVVQSNKFCYKVLLCENFEQQGCSRTIWWRFGAVGSNVGRINEVTLRRARLVLGWVTVSGFNSRCGKFSQFNQPPRSTQPGHPFVGRHNENRSKNGDALRLGSKSRYGVVCR